MSSVGPQTASLDYRSDRSPLAVRESNVLGLPLSAWIQMLAVAGCLSVLFWPNLRRLFLKTNPFTGEANWGHSVVIPVIGLYYLYLNRDELLRCAVKPAWTGLVIMIGGILIAGYGIYPGRNDTVWDYGMIITLFGVVLLLCGWQIMRIAWFPIVFLFAAIPLPGLVYSRMALPLQNIAAEVAVFTLQITGVDASVSGTKIHIGNPLLGGANVHTLNVAEACAGLRSLMTFISVAAAVAFLSSRPLWQKIIITASAIPIAITCNVMRVSGQGLLDHYWSREMSEGFAHQFVGLVMLVPAFFLILLVCWLLDKIFVEEVTETESGAAGGLSTRVTAAAPGKKPARQRRKVVAATHGASSAPAGPVVAGGVTHDAPRRVISNDAPVTEP